MDSDYSDNYEDLYEDSDVTKHEKLVDKVLSLNRTQQLKKPSRTEPTLQISEFNLVKSITGNKGSIRISELTKSLKDKKSRVKISQGLQKARKNAHTLPKPLEKPQADRIRRSVAYEKTRLELDRWESVVTSNRVSTNLAFPLDNDVNFDKTQAQNFPQMWRVKSKLEEELEKIEPKVEEYHINLKKDEFPLTLKEMLDRRQETAKLRAFQAHKEAKARRQSKIKSKKYHRILKKEKIKQKLKEFEQLQKTDPELALKKLEEIEKTRVEERFNLRHKSTGKWARNKQIRAKYDKESRQALAEQLTISRELTQKIKANESDSEEDVDHDENNPQLPVDENNPWVNEVKPEKEVADFVGKYRKYWIEKNKNALEEKAEEAEQSTENVDSEDKLEGDKLNGDKEMEINKSDIEDENGKNDSKEKSKGNVTKKKKSTNKKKKRKESKATADWEVEPVESGIHSINNIFDNLENKMQKMLKSDNRLNKLMKNKRPRTAAKGNDDEKKKIDLSLPLQVKKPVVDEELIQELNTDSDNVQKSGLETIKTILNSKTKKEANINPNKYLEVKTTNLSTAIPDILTTEENEEEEVNQRAIITEAFEDDDIVQEFNREKKNEVDKDKPKDIDLNLPGWGSWSGVNVKPNNRKRKRFIIKAPKKVPRRDDNKGSLIINEKAEKKIKEHMVSEIPFPFKTVKDFEASMRAPISNTFVPETAYKKLIQPTVTTKMGTIIEPITKNILLNKKAKF